MRVFHPTIGIFSVYAQEDAEIVQELEGHLRKKLQVLGSIAWHDRRIVTGMERSHAIDDALKSAQIILLYLSPDFLASRYWNSSEMNYIQQRQRANEARVIPILVRPVQEEVTPLGNDQPLPKNRRPITTWSDKDEAIVDVMMGIGQVIDEVFSNRKLQDALGPDFQVRQQAISQVAKADPKNIQEVAASQLSIINSYYQSGLQQSRQSFHWSLIWGGIGLGFLIAAISFLLLRQSTDLAFASGIGGAIVEVIAATYLYLYKHASDQLAAFRASLESTQRLLLANSMCEKLEGEIEQNTRAELIRAMVNSAIGTTLPAPDQKKK